jgi:AraC-like DNA-binding protein
MDPLSDVLSLLKLRNYLSGGFDVGGELSIQFPQYEGIKCYAVVSGQCWLSVDGVPDAVHLTAGDCFLLPRGWPFRLASDLTLTPVDALAILKTARRNGGIVTLNGGGNCCMVGGYFTLSGSHAGILLGVLPPIVHIRKESDKAALRWSLERMRQELLEPQPGGFLVAQQLAQMILVQALRLHLAEGLRGGVGWLFALADKQMSAAITSMHGDPAHRWTLQELAECAGMSRSTFALKFKETVGESPMEYLTRWRMLLAGDRLTNSGDPVSAIALSLGYESESAFSTAFKRVMGCSPRQYSRGRKPASPLHHEGKPPAPIGSNWSQVDMRSAVGSKPANSEQTAQHVVRFSEAVRLNRSFEPAASPLLFSLPRVNTKS